MVSETKQEVLLKVKAAQSSWSEDPERAEVFLRSAVEAAAALGHTSPALHLYLAELLYRLRRTRQALDQVIRVLELDPFNLVALDLARTLERHLA